MNLDLRILHYQIQHDCQKIEMLTKTTATLKEKTSYKKRKKIKEKTIKYEKYALLCLLLNEAKIIANPNPKATKITAMTKSSMIIHSHPILELFHQVLTSTVRRKDPM